jgi:hypothetical protein
METQEREPVPLYQLKRGDTFTIPDATQNKLPPQVQEPPDYAEDGLGELEFIKVDGMYAQVQAVDEEINERMSKSYDADANFFCISAGVEVIPTTEDDE